MQTTTYQSSLDSIKKDIDGFPNIPHGLVGACSSFFNTQRVLEDVKVNLQKLPVVSSSLISEVQDLCRFQDELQVVSDKLVKVNKDYEEVRETLKAFPCERLVNNLCPLS